MFLRPDPVRLRCNFGIILIRIQVDPGFPVSGRVPAGILKRRLTEYRPEQGEETDCHCQGSAHCHSLAPLAPATICTYTGALSGSRTLRQASTSSRSGTRPGSVPVSHRGMFSSDYSLVRIPWSRRNCRTAARQWKNTCPLRSNTETYKQKCSPPCITDGLHS